MMEETKRKRLEAQGWRVGTVRAFLDLAPAKVALIEMKAVLAASLRERRRGRMTQAQLAELIQSSQPRVARAEQGDQDVSFDLLLRAMLAMGATPQEIAQVIAGIDG